jgi:hypothetical protein
MPAARFKPAVTLNRNRLKRNRAAGAAHEHIRAQAGEE